jgi:hypothetical protein
LNFILSGSPPSPGIYTTLETLEEIRVRSYASLPHIEQGWIMQTAEQGRQYWGGGGGGGGSIPHTFWYAELGSLQQNLDGENLSNLSQSVKVIGWVIASLGVVHIMASSQPGWIVSQKFFLTFSWSFEWTLSCHLNQTNSTLKWHFGCFSKLW